MRLTRERQVPEGGSLTTFRTSWIGTLFSALVFSAAVGGSVFLLQRGAQELPGWVLVLLSPIALLVVVVDWLIVSAVWRACLASLRESNWTLKVGKGGVWLHLRSYMNQHLAEAEETVAFIPFGELLGARKLVERQRVGMSGEAEAHVSRLELIVADSATNDLRRAVQVESRREAPERRFLGVSSRVRSNHVPVLVSSPGHIHVTWHGRRVLRLLAENGVEILPKARAAVGQDADGVQDADSEIIGLIERGKKIKAIGLVRETYGMGLAEAKAFVEDLSVKPAA